MPPPDAEDLAGLYARPFRLTMPRAQILPFVFASPHSGRHYPAQWVGASRLDSLMLRRSEDAFVEELFAGVVELGAPLLTAEFPRVFLDVNRGAGEIDAAMFSGPLQVAMDPPSARVAAGLGVIPRIVRDGAEIYRGKLKMEEAGTRLEKLYRPYHQKLAALVHETCVRFGVAVVVDCHSMPSALRAPDIVLGDRYGASAAPALSRVAEQAFAREGFSVARNAPYAGGHTTILYGRPARGCHALQIEVNRGLYLDEDKIVRKQSFERIKLRLTAALTRLVRIAPSELLPASDLPAAAE
ncbi:MAG: N-formylglutamate amidohydrolase [Alphaproteobacteria bacterium]|nr:N-formylglutamate amidohydrolase [Alphaproteobacteria bacterium]